MQGRGCLSSLVYLRMRVYVSGRHVEQGVHMRVQQFLGWVGILLEIQLMSSCNVRLTRRLGLVGLVGLFLVMDVV
jgi:hypothetical protein